MRDESCKKASVGYCVLRPVQARLRLPPATCHLLAYILNSMRARVHDATLLCFSRASTRRGRAAEPDAGKRQEASVQEESQKVE
mmetsp:Transcript_36917/g.95605  ORF Transcript_36917/g.95605 Transcript_36917/m.95605 type:complete len:84 (-) Transcript_36917:40-291(-)